MKENTVSNLDTGIQTWTSWTISAEGIIGNIAGPGLEIYGLEDKPHNGLDWKTAFPELTPIFERALYGEVVEHRSTWKRLDDGAEIDSITLFKPLNGHVQCWAVITAVREVEAVERPYLMARINGDGTIVETLGHASIEEAERLAVDSVIPLAPGHALNPIAP